MERANRHWEKDREKRQKRMSMWEDLTKERLEIIASLAAAGHPGYGSG